MSLRTVDASMRPNGRAADGQHDRFGEPRATQMAVVAPSETRSGCRDDDPLARDSMRLANVGARESAR